MHVMHGKSNRTYADAGPLSAELLPNATLETHQGFPQGMPPTQADTINTDPPPS